MITWTPLTLAQRVDGQAKCDCGCVIFEVGIASTPAGNLFIRVLECSACRAQMIIVHETDAGLAPKIVRG